MKIYARVKKPYYTRIANQPKTNVIVGCGQKKYIEMITWKKLGYIPNVQFIPYDIEEYKKIKKELIEKGLIK
jgi:hypothetical protein